VIATTNVMSWVVWGVVASVGSFYFLMIAGRGRYKDPPKDE